MKPTVYTVTIDGRVYKRKSPRPYTHAVIGRCDIEKERAEAYGRQSTASFEYLRWVATAAPGSPYPKPGYRFTHEASPEQVAEARARVEGGEEAYEGRLRALAIARFEERVAENAFADFVLGWSQSAANAAKMAGSFAKSRTHVRVVEVGAVITEGGR